MRAGPHALAVLDAFAEPATIREVTALLGGGGGGAMAWRELTATITAFARAGVLVGDDAGDHVGPSGFASPPEHISMLDDETRTRAFLDAISRVVEPGDVVVDLGTGTGVLAIAAARAGARKVYAVEASHLARLLPDVLAANGVADRVEVVAGWSTSVRLPEPADVLVTETIGNEPLGEQILELVLDARARLLTPSARLIPRRLRITGQLVTLPDDLRERWFFGDAHVARWRRAYGVELGPLVDPRINTAQRWITHPDPARWRALSEPAVLADLDLAAVETPMVDAAATLTATADGDADGVVVSFEADLADGIDLHRSWQEGPAGNSWRVALSLFPERARLRQGDACAVRYQYRTARSAPGLVTLEPGAG